MKQFFKLLIVITLFNVLDVQAQFLHVQDKSIVDGNGENVILRGMGLGGWMLQEGYMLQLQSVANPQYEIKALVEEAIGVENAKTFYDAWLENHTTKEDVDSLAAWGFNSIRLPMHYNLYTLSIEEEPVKGENTWLDKGFAMTDNLLDWCAANEIYLILDLHAAPGGQGHDAAISDWNPAHPSLWESEDNKQKTIALWRKLAERYSDHPWIGGYDLINETNWGFDNPADLHGNSEENNIPLRKLLVDITTAIREVDTNHIIYLEGNSWANNYSGIFPPWDDNMVASFHKYWTVNDTESIQWMLAFRDEYNIPLWLGESGENSNTWYKDAISVCEQNNIGWAWWPLKKLGLNNALEIKKTQGYEDLIDYWEGNGAKPAEDIAFASLMEFAENTKIENCIFHPDVIDAMIRLPYSNEAKPFKDQNIIDGYKMYLVDFDMGGNDVGYSDKVVANYHVSSGSYTAWNSGWSYRNDGVDIEACEDEITNGYNVGFIEVGEWMQYTVNVEASGTYDLHIRSASEADENVVSIFINDLPVSNPIALPNTVGWQSWQSTLASDIYMEQGINVIRIHVDKGEYNLNYIEYSGPRNAEAVQPEFFGAYAKESRDTIILMAYNQPFTEIDDFSDFSVDVNGSSAEIDNVFVIDGQASTIAIELSNPLVYGDFVYVSYAGAEVNTTNNVVLDAYEDMSVNMDFQNPLESNRIPGKVEAENMNINQGFRINECADEGGGFAMGNSDPNDYLLFDINVLEAGTYQITYRHSGLGGTGKINLYKNINENEEFIESMEFNSTLGWQNWSDKVGVAFDLEEGFTQIKVDVELGNFNLNYLNFSLVAVPAEAGLKFLKGYSNENGDKLFLEFNKPILESSIASTGFSLMVNGVVSQISSVELNSENILQVLLSNPLGDQDIVKMAYGNGGNIESTVGENLELFEYTLINNNTIELNLQPIPGKIEVEDFAVNNGFEFENCKDDGGGKNAGYTDIGDYLDFDVNIEEDGVYDLSYRVASESAGGSLSLQTVKNNSTTTLNTVSFAATGGWQNWTTVKDQVTLAKGIHRIRLLSKGSLFNINWIEFNTATAEVLGLFDNEPGFTIYPNPSENNFTITMVDEYISSDQINVYDLSGQLLDLDIHKIHNQEYLVKHNLRAGLYLIFIKNREGAISQKLIVN